MMTKLYPNFKGAPAGTGYSHSAAVCSPRSPIHLFRADDYRKDVRRGLEDSLKALKADKIDSTCLPISRISALLICFLHPSLLSPWARSLPHMGGDVEGC